MKLDKILFATILVMWVVVILVSTQPAIEGARGTAHPQVSSMFHGGSGVDRHGEILWVGWLFGSSALIVCFALMIFGGRQREKLRGGLGWRLLTIAAATLAAWTWLILAYRDSLQNPSDELFLALPIPTAIQLYFFLPITLTSMLCFVLGFKRWVLTDEDQEKFEQLLAAKRQREGAPEANQEGGS